MNIHFPVFLAVIFESHLFNIQRGETILNLVDIASRESLDKVFRYYSSIPKCISYKIE
jgi:hypothetical protein